MHYNVSHQHWQLDVLNLLKTTLARLLRPWIILFLHFLIVSRLSQLHNLTLNRLLKPFLALLPLVLLPYSVNTQALSATTSQVINGSNPYLTLDNGVTKVTDINSLLAITLSDGTTITPATNTSTMVNPIVLPNDGETLGDVKMLVPTSANSIALNDLISAPNNYWGDDDGDGQGTNGITASGSLKVSIFDKEGQAVSRSAALDICQAPYKVVLASTNISLTTQYGIPNSSNFYSRSTIYYINPKGAPKVCYAKPSLTKGVNRWAGPVTIWSPTKGFLAQTTESSSYNRNFPTTGANNLYFDLDIGGTVGSSLTWPTVSQGGITATMTRSPDNTNNIRVTLTGPMTTPSQWNTSSPGSVATATLPQTFELVGKDSSNREVLKYGFELKHWFVSRLTYDYYSGALSWCRSLGGGYHLPQIKDLTNTKCGTDFMNYFPCVNGIDGATPSSNWWGSQRNIGAGFFAEWGDMNNYPRANIGSPTLGYWTTDRFDSRSQFYVFPSSGSVNYSDNYQYTICTYP